MRVLAMFCVLVTAVPSAMAQGPTASQPLQPQRILLRIDQGKAITKGFLGFGVELDPMALNANTRRRASKSPWKMNHPPP